ncbi:MAG TPA: hypothetical protein VKA18_14065, partial [Alphaproteobacteria bacterium]|nr:hypothetical protein [Alphaproteobacteria bacterium]
PSCGRYLYPLARIGAGLRDSPPNDDEAENGGDRPGFEMEDSGNLSSWNARLNGKAVKGHVCRFVCSDLPHTPGNTEKKAAGLPTAFSANVT